MGLIEEIHKRKTFGIVSHPDAGKTTLTEKLLLFGGAIQVAGAVKSNKIKKHATSDFMEIERQRGISVATSVTARAACICFCAMRPAKSLSKKVTACPSVQRCSRDRTSGITFGPITMEFEAEDAAKDRGRRTR